MRKGVVFMKKVWKMAVCGLVCAMAFCGCGTSESVSEEANADRVVKKEFADPVFEKYLRSALGNLGGELTEGELGAIKQIGIGYWGNGMSISYNNVNENLNFSDDICVPYLTEESEWGDAQRIYIQSLEDLEKLPNLEVVCLEGGNDNVNVFKNFDFVKELPNLKVLTGTCAAPTLEPLRNCTALERLWLHSVNDISPLADCTNLRILELHMNESTGGFSALENLNQLEQLNIQFYSDTSFDANVLKDMKNLEHLEILGASMDNPEVLLELPNLKEFYFFKDDIGIDDTILQQLRDKGVQMW